VIFISYVASNEDLFKIITAEGNLTAFGSALIAQFVVFAIMDAIAITLHVLDYKSRESIQARKRMITTRQAVAAYKKMKAENNRNLKMLFEFEEIIEKQQKKLKHLRASLYESHLIAKEAVKLEDQVQFLSKKIKTAQSRVNDLRKKLVFEKMSFEQKIIFVKKVLQAQYSTKSTKHLTADQLKEHRVTEAKQDAKIKEVLAKRCTAEQRDATHELVSVKKLQERYAKEYDRAKKYVDDLIKNHSEQAHKTVIKQQKRIAKRKGREAAHAKREHARKERRLKKEQRRKAKLEKRHSSVTRQKKHSSKLAKQHAKEVKKAQKQHIKAQKLAKKQRERVQKEEQRKKT
jgi:hypothetical protein